MTIALRQRPLARVVAGIVRANDGALFDPSDMSTLYQDAAGTIPVTAVEQPVGLMLDKARGVMLGPERVSGFYESGDDGVNTVTLFSDGFDINQVNANTVATATITGNFVVGRTYKITSNLNVIAGAFKIQNVAWNGGTALIISSNTFFIKCTQPTTQIGVYRSSPLEQSSISMRNISVKELYGYHATQSITASRPTLSARYNLLTKTEDFSDAAWTKLAAGTATAPVVTNNYGVAPDGSITAARLQLALNGGTTTTDRSYLLQQPALISGATYASTFWVKSNTAQSYVVQQRLGLLTQNITIDQTWRAYTYSQTIASDNSHWLALRGAQGTSDAADILIWHPQLIIGATTGPYQRVNTATDYDTDERYFKKYLRFDGVDDYLNLPYMGLYANGSASVVAAYNLRVTGYSEYLISERSSSTANPAYLLQRKNYSPSNLGNFIRNDAGTILADDNSTQLTPSPVAVISVVDSGSGLSTYVNSKIGGAVAYSRAGVLTPTNTIIGASVSTATGNFANMNLYGLIITKSDLTDSQRIACERYLGRKSGVQL